MSAVCSSQACGETDKKLKENAEYVSRRLKNYDDNDSSNDGEDDGHNSYLNTGAITYKDTKGREFTLKPNSRFANYKENF